MWNSIVRRRSKPNETAILAGDDANTKTSPPTSPTKLPVGVVLGSSPERAVVRLRHTFSLGLTDRSKLRSSGGSLTSGTDELAAKNSTHALSPENVRKRFSAGSGGKRTSSTLRLDSPTEIQEETFELPAIITTAPSGQSRYDSAHFLDRVNDPAARCRAFQEDTDSLQSDAGSFQLKFGRKLEREKKRAHARVFSLKKRKKIEAIHN